MWSIGRGEWQDGEVHKWEGDAFSIDRADTRRTPFFHGWGHIWMVDLAEKCWWMLCIGDELWRTIHEDHLFVRSCEWFYRSHFFATNSNVKVLRAYPIMVFQLPIWGGSFDTQARKSKIRHRFINSFFIGYVFSNICDHRRQQGASTQPAGLSKNINPNAVVLAI